MANAGFSNRFRWPVVALIALNLMTGVLSGAEESLPHYFEQLRQRGLFSIAESYAVSRRSQSNLPRARRVELTIELSRTLSRHAEFASELQQQELWKRAVSIVEEERSRDPKGPYAIVLTAQAAIVPADEVDWLRFECQLKPFDEELAAHTRQQCSLAIQQLSDLEKELLSPQRKENADAPTSHALRVWLHNGRLALAQSLRSRAELSPPDSRERAADLVDAESTARKLVAGADEPTPFQAKLLLADCMRLKGDFAKAEEMLAVLSKAVPGNREPLADDVTALKSRVLLDRRQAPDALELIVQARSNRNRLSGELWYLQTRALLTMRDLAVAKKDENLAQSLRQQAEITLERCDEQVGGFWSRRCRQLWESDQTAEKYGPELDALMQQARADYLGGRIEAAIKNYARGELIARAAMKTDLASELGYTRASILLQQKNYEAAGTEFLRLATDYPDSPRVAAAHLNGAYCLGRQYDEQKTQSRRELYTAELDRHIERFAADPTADDARFFKAQLEEQRLQSTVALPLYLKIPATHPRFAEATAAAARCFETILFRMRERKLPTTEFEQMAVTTLEPLVPKLDSADAAWTANQCELALHLATILLVIEPTRFDRAEQLLSQVSRSASETRDAGDQPERWRQLQRRSDSLRIVAMAGNGHLDEAERLVDSLAVATPRDLLVTVERLAPFVASDNRQRQVQYVALQLRVIEQLSKHRQSLSRGEQEQLDSSVGRAYMASGQITKAIEVYSRLAAASVKDAHRQQEIASLLADYDPKECTVLAKQCWRRVETLTKQGTPEWLTARLGVINTCIKLNEQVEASKLLAATMALYPDLGNPELKARFAAAEKKVEAMKPAGK